MHSATPIPTSRRPRARRWLLYLALAIGAIPLLLPLAWMVTTSLKPEFAVFEFPPQFLPRTFRFENYLTIFTDWPFGRQYFNSVYIAILTVLGTAVVSSLAGYALARLRFPGRGLVLPLLLGALLLPIEVIIVPLYALMSQLGWIGTHLPLIVEPIFGAPSVVGTFLMRQFFLSLPRELEDAGRVDGLSTFGVFWRIALPLARPAIATLAILTFLASWNAYLEPLVFTSGNVDLLTIPVALGQFSDQFGEPTWTLQMAATTLSILPVVAVFLLAQRHIVAGIARSGLKG
jgi:multiple sugar transport system permease protein